MSTMVGEIFENCISEMTRNALKLFTMVGENFEICITEMAINALKTTKNALAQICLEKNCNSDFLSSSFRFSERYF